jgi:hypothetical protein
MNKFQPQRGVETVENSCEIAYGGSSENVFYKSVSPAADMADVNTANCRS